MSNKERQALIQSVITALNNVSVCGRYNLDLQLTAIQRLSLLMNDMKGDENHED